eukprot:CAMPEP_0206487820 /NCGR_PEP_ID=MMETSP0324_2-20121206/41929_1 /ASSEMBLY_ACC=CAM_ASM_000836 /TAXON_ID=2866 /ORGANISM="Crypthecodinium cohnii, Strain Seligo" /LENGTH=129 /DNA_ID=CAMNT_0053966495 /DNA_START=13 /DNA_END=399 /DNA_ORIENTATION=+
MSSFLVHPPLPLRGSCAHPKQLLSRPDVQAECLWHWPGVYLHMEVVLQKKKKKQKQKQKQIGLQHIQLGKQGLGLLLPSQGCPRTPLQGCSAVARHYHSGEALVQKQIVERGSRRGWQQDLHRPSPGRQ